VGYRHASGSWAAIGDVDRTTAYAAKASDLAPDDFDFALHAGCLLLDAKRIEEALLYLTRAVAIEPQSPRALRALSAAVFTLERPDEALSLALQAAALAPKAKRRAVVARLARAIFLMGSGCQSRPGDNCDSLYRQSIETSRNGDVCQ
jgi:tetratricopeptide (TPR) repeat protein